MYKVKKWECELLPLRSTKPNDKLPRFFILLLMMESLEETPTPVTGLRLAVMSKPSHNMQHQKPHAPHQKQHMLCSHKS
jgi:hypothetical protein